MEHYSLRTNPTPFKPQIPHPYSVLYKMDRKYVLEKERYDKGDMRLYDMGIVREQKQNDKKKIELLKELSDVLKKSKKSIEVSFNEFNGYDIKINGKWLRLYNYLKCDIIEQLIVQKFY